jgi:hypothetical protein
MVIISKKKQCVDAVLSSYFFTLDDRVFDK